MYVGTSGDIDLFVQDDINGDVINSPWPGASHLPEDYVYAGAGNDLVFANGKDSVFLGDGDDTVVYDPSGGRLGGFDNNTVTGGGGFDTVILPGSISDYGITASVWDGVLYSP